MHEELIRAFFKKLCCMNFHWNNRTKNICLPIAIENLNVTMYVCTIEGIADSIVCHYWHC